MPAFETGRGWVGLFHHDEKRYGVVMSLPEVFNEYRQTAIVSS